MQYDMAAKRAQRLLRKNWREVVAEAHRLGGLDLPGVEVEVNPDEELVCIYLYAQTLPRGYCVYISAGGYIDVTTLIQWQDGHWERENVLGKDVQAVAQVLSAALEEAQNRASKMGDIAKKLAEVH
jgi:hypothetical protein